jgi:hypothetical protein
MRSNELLGPVDAGALEAVNRGAPRHRRHPMSSIGCQRPGLIEAARKAASRQRHADGAHTGTPGRLPVVSRSPDAAAHQPSARRTSACCASVSGGARSASSPWSVIPMP